MPVAALEQYIRRVGARQAELALLLAEVIMLPSMKKGDRKRVIARWQDVARPGRSRLRVKGRPEDIRKLGLGVLHVPERK